MDEFVVPLSRVRRERLRRLVIDYWMVGGFLTGALSTVAAFLLLVALSD